MKIPKFRSNYFYPRLPQDHEKPVGESLTIQDQSYTVKELLFKSQQGISPGIARKAYYQETEDFEDTDETKLPDFDLSDVTRIQNDLLESIERKKRAKLEHAKKLREEKKNKKPDTSDDEPEKVIDKKPEDQDTPIVDNE